MGPDVVQTISGIVGAAGGKVDWGLVVAGVAALGAIVSPIVYWLWSRRFARIQKEIHSWQTRQRSPEALLVQAHIERLIDETHVQFHPEDIAGMDSRTGFRVTVQLNNPGDVPIHVLRTTVVLEGTLYTGCLARQFGSDSKHGLIPPHSLKDFFLFASDPHATARDKWPAVRFLVEYVAGPASREMTLQFPSPGAGPATGPVPLSPEDSGQGLDE